MIDLKFTTVITYIINQPALLVTILLTLGVIFVNGWTDAPNSIATCVVTRSMSAKKAVLMSALFNFLGLTVMTLYNSKVVSTIKNIVNFNGNARLSIIALCASLFAIIIWAVAAWFFGIPTSESHALIAGLSGAAIALQNGIQGINVKEWLIVIYGLFYSIFLGFFSGYIITKIIELFCKNTNRLKTLKFFKYSEITGGALMSFMHGAQDGQKFMGVLLLSLFLANGSETTSNINPPIWLMLICSLVMALGTSVGGYKIIKSVGMNMVKLEKYQGFAADLASAFSLFFLTIFGVPVSTTHTKTTAIMGVGASKRMSAINFSIVKEMILTWVLTFPCCTAIGYIMAKLFLYIFS